MRAAATDPQGPARVNRDTPGTAVRVSTFKFTKQYMIAQTGGSVSNNLITEKRTFRINEHQNCGVLHVNRLTYLRYDKTELILNVVLLSFFFSRLYGLKQRKKVF